MPFYYDFTVTHDNAYLRAVRTLYRPLHFDKGYNFPLWIIFGGAMFGFGLARLEYLDIDGIFAQNKIVNGDWYYWRSGYQHIGIILHLVAVPMCLFVPWQFLPIIRHKALWFHRMNGYLSMLMMLVSIAGAFMIARNAFGGSLMSQLEVYTLGFWVTASLIMSYVNIKRLQIDQHRNWMLRAWFAAASIITTRLLQLAIWEIISRMGGYYFPLPCLIIDFITESLAHQPLAAKSYPECAANPNAVAPVLVDFYGQQPEQIGAALNASFPLAFGLAMVLHAAGVEVYIRLTPAETDRLKQVSYEKQLARGFKHPGIAGLTAETWGDALPFVPAVKETWNGGKDIEQQRGMSDSGNSEIKAPEDVV